MSALSKEFRRWASEVDYVDNPFYLHDLDRPTIEAVREIRSWKCPGEYLYEAHLEGFAALFLLFIAEAIE